MIVSTTFRRGRDILPALNLKCTPYPKRHIRHDAYNASPHVPSSSPARRILGPQIPPIRLNKRMPLCKERDRCSASVSPYPRLLLSSMQGQQGQHSPHINQQLQAESTSVDRQTL